MTKKEKILMRIDFQNDFVHPQGALTINAPKLIEKHQHFANSLFANTFDKIIDSYDTHFAETYPHTMEAAAYPVHCVQGSWGWQQAAPFKEGMPVVKMYKSTTNIWNEINAYKDLADSWKDKEVYLCGVLSDVCVCQALNGLLKRGAQVVLIEDLCQGINKQITDIVQDKAYRPFVRCGYLKLITSAQFFRTILHQKKIDQNRVFKAGENNNEQHAR